MSSHANMLSLLSAHRVNELPSRKDGVVVVTTEDNFATAFKRIVAAKVTAAPCYDTESKQFVGFISLKDLIPLALAVHDKSVAAANKHMLSNTDALLKEIWEHLQTNDKGITLALLARRNPFVSIESGATLAQLAKVLVRLRATRVRRVAVLSEDGSSVVNVVSQMSLVHFVSSKLNLVNAAEDPVKLSELAQTVEEAKVGSYPCISVDENSRTYDVLKQLDALDKGGIAVTGEPDGQVLGNVSGRDLKHFLAAPTIAEFEMPVGKFLDAIRREQVDIAIPVIECKKSDTLRKVLFKFSGSRKHRVYVTDELHRPIGVISLGDMIHALFSGAVEQMSASTE